MNPGDGAFEMKKREREIHSALGEINYLRKLSKHLYYSKYIATL